MKIKKGDMVKVTAGKDKGRTGRVEKVIPALGAVVLPGINQYKKHVKPQGEGRSGEIVTLSRPLTMGKIALICPKCKQATRVGYKFDKGRKLRVCRKCAQDI